jgi:hypothetical protein
MAYKVPISYRLTAQAYGLLCKIAESDGISQSAVLELLIRAKAKQDGLPYMDGVELQEDK